MPKKAQLDLTLYQLKKDNQIADYRDRVVPVLDWTNMFDLSSNDILEDVMVDNDLPHGIYCTFNGDDTDYFEYFDMDAVPDAMHSIYHYNREPKLAAFRIHYAETETVKDKERYTGRTYSALSLFNYALEAPDEVNYIGDLHPDDFMEIIHEQFQREKETKKKKRRRPAT